MCKGIELYLRIHIVRQPHREFVWWDRGLLLYNVCLGRAEESLPRGRIWCINIDTQIDPPRCLHVHVPMEHCSTCIQDASTTHIITQTRIFAHGFSTAAALFSDTAADFTCS